MLRNTVALISNAASALGRATAVAFAREGSRVVLADVNVAAAHETLRAMQKVAPRTEAFVAKLDVSKPEDHQSVIQQVMNRFGHLNVAVNTAGILAEDVKANPDQIAKVARKNLEGVMYGMKAQIGAMKQNGGGSIVNTAVLTDCDHEAALSAYRASRAAVIGLTKTASLENEKHKIRVNAMLPGTISTADCVKRTTPTYTPCAQQVAAGVTIARMYPAGTIIAPNNRPMHVDELAHVIAVMASAKCTGVVSNGGAV